MCSSDLKLGGTCPFSKLSRGDDVVALSLNKDLYKKVCAGGDVCNDVMRCDVLVRWGNMVLK